MIEPTSISELTDMFKPVTVVQAESNTVKNTLIVLSIICITVGVTVYIQNRLSLKTRTISTKD